MFFFRYKVLKCALFVRSLNCIFFVGSLKRAFFFDKLSIRVFFFFKISDIMRDKRAGQIFGTVGNSLVSRGGGH